MCAASIINNLIDVHHLYECMRIMRHEPYLARYIYIYGSTVSYSLGSAIPTTAATAGMQHM